MIEHRIAKAIYGELKRQTDEGGATGRVEGPAADCVIDGYDFDLRLVARAALAAAQGKS